MNSKRIAFILLIGLTSLHILGQDCYQNLEDAQIAYYDGKFDRAIELLKDCKKNALEKADQLTRMHLLINAYILDKNIEAAEKLMKELLTHNPSYHIKSSDLPEFRQLFEEFEIKTPWQIGLVAGWLVPDYQVLRYQSYGSQVQEPQDYSNNPGFALGLSVDRNLFHRLFLNGSIVYQRAGYQQQEILLQYQKVFIKETQSYLAIPLQFKYYILKSKLSPFVGAGFSWHYLLSTKADLDHLPLPTDIVSGKNRGSIEQVSNYDISAQRKTLNSHMAIQGGFKYNLSNYTLEAKITYERGLNNVVKNRYSDPVLIHKYAYVSDDFKRDHYSITIGIFRAIRKPMKK